jgi:hypothetical protein
MAVEVMNVRGLLDVRQKGRSQPSDGPCPEFRRSVPICETRAHIGEDFMIARSVCHVLRLATAGEKKELRPRCLSEANAEQERTKGGQEDMMNHTDGWMGGWMGGGMWIWPVIGVLLVVLLVVAINNQRKK